MSASVIMAFFLALVVNRILEHLFKPLRSLLLLYIAPNTTKLAWLDFITPYVAWVAGGVLSWYTDIDLISALVPSIAPLVAKLLTAIVIGGGAGLIHDIFDPLPTKGREFWAKLHGLYPDQKDKMREMPCACKD